MTIVERAAYLKGLTEGLDLQSDPKQAKLWNCLNELMCDIAHEIESLHEISQEHEDVLDDMSEQIMFIEEMVEDCFDDDDDDDEDDDDDDDYRYSRYDDDCDWMDDDEDADEPEDAEEGDYKFSSGEDYDGVIYDAICPVCNEEISFDEEILSEGSIVCPSCGKTLEFDTESIKDKD